MSRFPEVSATTPWAYLRDRPVRDWGGVLDALGARWRVATEGAERLPGGEDCAAFAVGSWCVVKLLPPGSPVDREVALLGRVALSVPTPRLRDRHDEDGWTALLLSRLPGRLVGAAWPTFDEATRQSVLGQLGEIAKELRATPVAATDARPDLRAEAARHGPEATAWIARWAPPGPEGLLHGDLTDENVLVEDGRVSGVLDFGGCFVGPAGLELVSPGLFLGRGVPGRVTAFAASAGLEGGPEARLAWHLLHPYGQLARDLALCGVGEGTLAAALAVWRDG